MALPRSSINYKKVGVDIDLADRLIEQITPAVKKTRRPEVISNLGGYSGLFALNLKKYPKPLLVSTTDGVGTKLKLSFEMNQFNTIGQDLVAMCVNDLICCGAEPLFFLDYFATGKLDLPTTRKVIEGIASSLAKINCTLIGGETAEMPGFYQKGEFDLAGFAVGVVNRNRVIDGQKIRAGNKIIGLLSSGLHSNGFSLVRKIIEQSRLDLKKPVGNLKKSLGEILLTPTAVYVNPILFLLAKFQILGIAHITGGGLIENVPRILPQNVTAHFDKTAIPVSPIFKLLKEWGSVVESEMWRVFNMGIGMVIVVSDQDEKNILSELKKINCPAQSIGEIVLRKGDEVQVKIK